MRRREFIAGLGGAAAGWPQAARAQRSVPVIGLLHPASPQTWDLQSPAFLRGLAEEGYFDGGNVTINYVWGQNRFDRLPALANELARREPSVFIAVGGTSVVRVAMAATKKIPIVFHVGANPVDAGLIASLARPGGNATGVTVLTNDLMAKRIEALHSTVPFATAIALLTNSANPVVGNAEAELAQQAAQALGLNVTVFDAGTPDDIEAAFTALARQPVGALVVSADPLFLDQRDRLSTLTARHGIPSIYSYRANVAAGGLMSYGAAFAESYRLVGVYTGRILKGDKAADLPVQQVTKLELVINLKTAKALGLTIPETLLATADEVIQ
jgi:putative tryptophan/tyrosine transport system substrate-binding protein